MRVDKRLVCCVYVVVQCCPWYYGSPCTKGIPGRVPTDTLDWPLIDPWLTLDWHLIDTQLTYPDWHSVNTRLTLHQHLNQHLTDTWSTRAQQSVSVNRLICSDWHSLVCLQKLVNSRPTVDWDVDWVLTKYWSRCQSSVDRDVDWASIEGIRLTLVCGCV